MDNITRILVTKFRHHGDVLLVTPVFNALYRCYPGAKIDALIYSDTLDMLSNHPVLNNIYMVKRKSGVFENLRLLKSLGNNRYDMIINLTSNSRGAWLSRLLSPIISVAPVHAGWLYQNSFTHLYKSVYGHRRHTVENNLDALRCIGLIVNEEDKYLSLSIGAEIDAEVVSLLEKINYPSRGYILLHPTSRWLFKCWSEDKVAAVADRLIDCGFTLLFTSGPDTREMEMISRIQAMMTRSSASLAGQLSLKQLAALIARARLLVGVDSAPMHMAAALGTPVVALFGPSSEIDWGPWQVPSRIIVSDHTCRPCGLDGCGGGKHSECLETIAVERVFNAALELLGSVS
jgi:heptosyltransferase-3